MAGPRRVAPAPPAARPRRVVRRCIRRPRRRARHAVAVAAQRCVNHYEGVKLRAVGAFAGPEPRDDTSEGGFAWTDVAGALRLGEGQARQLTHQGRRLRTHLHRTLAGMLAGDVSLA